MTFVVVPSSGVAGVDIAIAVGATPTFEATLLVAEAGDPADLTGCTVQMQTKLGNSPEFRVHPVTIESAEDGEVSSTFSPADTYQVAFLYLRFKVTDSEGSVTYYPDEHYLLSQVAAAPAEQAAVIVDTRRKTATLTVTAAMCQAEDGSEVQFPFADAMPPGAIFVGAFVDLEEKFTDSVNDNRWGVGIISTTATAFADPDALDGTWKRSWCGFTSVGTAGTGPSQALGKNAGPNVWAGAPYEFYTAGGWVGNAIPNVLLFCTEGSETNANLITAGSVTATIVYDDYTS